MNNEIKVTIFTPTYNRVHLLDELYNTLVLQTNKEFIWLIVDDGSTDETKATVEKWKKENLIRIDYIYQPNSGKMNAHNRAVLHCNTPFFIDIDSDDKAKKDCVEYLYSKMPLIEDDPNICGLMCYYNEVGKRINTDVFNHKNNTLATLSDVYADGYRGETTLLFKTNVLKRFLFPEIDGEKFIPEGYIYNQIDEKYKFLCLNNNIVFGNYQEDGYSRNPIKLYINNPFSFSLLYLQLYKKDRLLSKLVRFMAFRFMSKKPIEFRKNNLPWYAIILVGISYILQLKWKYMYMKDAKKRNY